MKEASRDGDRSPRLCADPRDRSPLVDHKSICADQAIWFLAKAYRLDHVHRLSSRFQHAQPKITIRRLVGERGVVPGLAQARDHQVRECGCLGDDRHTRERGTALRQRCDERNTVLRNWSGDVALIYIVPMDVIPTHKPTVFTTRWCGYCIRLKSQLSRAGIDFHEIDIEDHADGAALVAQVNNGNLTVPTVLFRDGSALTNPSAAQVGSRLS
jgi:mycoredoxin